MNVIVIDRGLPGWTVISAPPGKTARGPRLRIGHAEADALAAELLRLVEQQEPLLQPARRVRLGGAGVGPLGRRVASPRLPARGRRRARRPSSRQRLARAGGRAAGRGGGDSGSAASACGLRRQATTIHQPTTCQATTSAARTATVTSACRAANAETWPTTPGANCHSSCSGEALATTNSSGTSHRAREEPPVEPPSEASTSTGASTTHHVRLGQPGAGEEEDERQRHGDGQEARRARAPCRARAARRRAARAPRAGRAATSARPAPATSVHRRGDGRERHGADHRELRVRGARPASRPSRGRGRGGRRRRRRRRRRRPRTAARGARRRPRRRGGRRAASARPSA